MSPHDHYAIHYRPPPDLIRCQYAGNDAHDAMRCKFSGEIETVYRHEFTCPFNPTFVRRMTCQQPLHDGAICYHWMHDDAYNASRCDYRTYHAFMHDRARDGYTILVCESCHALYDDVKTPARTPLPDCALASVGYCVASSDDRNAAAVGLSAATTIRSSSLYSCLTSIKLRTSNRSNRPLYRSDPHNRKPSARSSHRPRHQHRHRHHRVRQLQLSRSPTRRCARGAAAIAVVTAALFVNTNPSVTATHHTQCNGHVMRHGRWVRTMIFRVIITSAVAAKVHDRWLRT